MRRLLNELILTPLLAEVRITDGHHECHAVCIGASPAETTMLYPSGQQGNARSAPSSLVTRPHISCKRPKTYGFS